jgi:LPS-assembly protein
VPDAPDAADLPVAQPVTTSSRNMVPVHITANRQRKDGSIYTLLGDVEIHYGSYVLHADNVNYNEDTGEVRAEGHLDLEGGQDDERILADHATLNLNLDTGRFYNVTGSVGVRGNLARRKAIYTTTNPFLFTGRVVIKSGPSRFRVIDGTMTSCRLPKPDWVLSAGRIDVGEGQASARNALFRLLNIPIVYLPYVTHPVMSSDRQSGFLIPVFSQSSTKGTVLGEQYYLVLNRSMDLTLGTDYYSMRGWAPSGEFRFRGRKDDFADVRFTALFDRGIVLGTDMAPTNQGGQDVLVNGRFSLNDHTRLVANAEYLSSIIYRLAFAESFAQATASQVNSNIYVTHNDAGFSETGSFARYINYGSTAPIEDVVIAHLPSISATSVERPFAATPLRWRVGGSVAGLNRREPGFETAHEVGRVDLHPSFSAPLHLGGLDIRPEIGLRDTFYTKSQAPTFVLNTATQSFVPVYRSASLDRKAFEAGLELRAPVIERDYAFGWLTRNNRVLRHVIEPEAHYQYVSGIDNFRNILRFDPIDLVSDTNEVEYSVTQRFYFKRLHARPCATNSLAPPTNGRVYLPLDFRDCTNTDTTEALTWTLAQKHYFDPTFGGAVFPNRRNVLATTLDLTGISFLAGPRDYSPLISRLQLRTSRTFNLGWDLDYDPHAGRINGSNVYADLRSGNFFGSVSHARLDALNATTTSSLPGGSTQPMSSVTNYEQLRVTLGYGAGTKSGFSSALNAGYDLNRTELQYAGAEASYNFNCCGITIEYRRLALGSQRNENYESFNFTLAGIGTAGNINRSQLIY